MTTPTLFPTLSNIDSVGTITLKNDELIIGREEKLVHAYIQSEDRENVRVGDYIRIPYKTNQDGKERMMFGEVTRLQYRQKTDFDDQNDGELERDVAEHNFSYVARIEPVAILVDNGERDDEAENKDERIVYERKTVSIPPRPQSRVFIVNDRKFLRNGLDLPENGNFAGFLAVAGDKVPSSENPLPYYFTNPGYEEDGEPQIFRHTLVCGSTGKGKTHFSKNVLRQYVDMDTLFEETIPNAGDNEKTVEPRPLNISIIDPEDEYIELRHDSMDMDDKDKEMCDAHGIKYGGVGSPDCDSTIEAWQPQVNKPYESKGDKSFYIPFRIVEDNPRLLMNFDAGDATEQEIRDLISEYFRTHGNNPTYSEFSEWARNRIPEKINSESVQNAVERRVVNVKEFNEVFDAGRNSIYDCDSEIFQRNQITVFPMRHLKGSTENLVVMCLLSFIVSSQLSTSGPSKHVNGTPMMLCVDEAHKYLSEPTTQQEQVIINKARETAKRGRKENFGLYTVTQNPQDIDEEIRKQTNTKIFLGLDANVVESSDVHTPTEFKERIKELDKGEAVVQAPGKRPIEVQGLPFCVTRHE